MGVTKILGALALAATVGMAVAGAAEAQQTQSRLYEVTKSKKLRVCQFPLYYSISFRNPKTGEIDGIDAEGGSGDAARVYATLLKRLASDQGVEYGELTFFGDMRYTLSGRSMRAVLDRGRTAASGEEWTCRAMSMKARP